MPTEIAKTNGHGPLPEAIERALVSGDLASLNTKERLAFYHARCQAAGLDPRAQPFEYIHFTRGKQAGKLALYATKAATDQLIANHKLSVAIVSRGMDFETHCYVVNCRVTFPDGQFVEDIGVVSMAYADDRGDLGILKGEAAANAQMKATTKAKRRTVLSACGLGMLDESEVDSIPDALPVPAEPSRIDGPRPVPMSYPRETAPVYAEQKAKTRSEFRQFCDQRTTDINDIWRNFLTLERKDSLFKPLANVSQLANHLVKVWVASGKIVEANIQTDGKRDRAKVGATLTRLWETERAEIEQEVGRYLRGLLADAASKNGIEMPEPYDGDVWDEEHGSVPVAAGE